MICRECQEGRRYAEGSIFCTWYGIIIRENHECSREGGKRHDGEPGGDRENNTNRAELQQNGGNAAGGMPGVFQRTSERASVFGVEEEWPE